MGAEVSGLWPCGGAGGIYRVRDPAGLDDCSRFKLDPRCDPWGPRQRRCSPGPHSETQGMMVWVAGRKELARRRLHFPFCICFLLFRRSEWASTTLLSSREMILSSLSVLKSVWSGKSRAVVHRPLLWGTLLGSTLPLTQPWRWSWLQKAHDTFPILVWRRYFQRELLGPSSPPTEHLLPLPVRPVTGWSEQCYQRGTAGESFW